MEKLVVSFTSDSVQRLNGTDINLVHHIVNNLKEFSKLLQEPASDGFITTEMFEDKFQSNIWFYKMLSSICQSISFDCVNDSIIVIHCCNRISSSLSRASDATIIDWRKFMQMPSASLMQMRISPSFHSWINQFEKSRPWTSLKFLHAHSKFGKLSKLSRLQRTINFPQFPSKTKRLV